MVYLKPLKVNNLPGSFLGRLLGAVTLPPSFGVRFSSSFWSGTVWCCDVGLFGVWLWGVSDVWLGGVSTVPHGASDDIP